VDVAIVFAFASVVALGLVVNHCRLSPLPGVNGHAMAAQASYYPVLKGKPTCAPIHRMNNPHRTQYTLNNPHRQMVRKRAKSPS